MASRILAACGLVALACSASMPASEVAVLRGGTRIELKGPLVRRGNTLLLTRADGTLLSLPASELDLPATAAANAASPSPRPASAVARVPETPVEAARSAREGPKARVRVTDADVGHQVEAFRASGEKKEPSGGSGAGRVEIADYDQQRSEADLLVRGSLRNPGATSATSVRLNVTAVDEKGQPIASAPALLSSVSMEPGRTVTFSARLAVGQTPVASLRFAPQWISIPLAPAGLPASSAAPSAPSSGPAAEPSGPRPAAQPAGGPVPYGQGVLYAAPPPSAPSQPPADGKSGYIPGASSPENQPKTPQ